MHRRLVMNFYLDQAISSLAISSEIQAMGVYARRARLIVGVIGPKIGGKYLTGTEANAVMNRRKAAVGGSKAKW